MIRDSIQDEREKRAQRPVRRIYSKMMHSGKTLHKEETHAQLLYTNAQVIRNETCCLSPR